MIWNSPSIGGTEHDCSKLSEPDFYTPEYDNVLDYCINQGASLYSRSPDGETPLHWLVSLSTNPGLVDAMLSRILNDDRENYVNARTKDGMTPMHLAAKIGKDHGMMVRLKSWGADIDTPLTPKKPSFLSRFNVLSNNRGKTPLHLAVERESGETFVTTLLALGANPDAQDKRERSPLHDVVIKATDNRLISLLLVKGDINLKDDKGNTPLHLASTRNTRTMTIQYLINNGADPNEANDEGETPLHLAAAYNANPEIVTLLVDSTEEPCAEDKKDASAFEYIKQNRSLQNTPPYWKLHELCFERKQ